MGIHTPTISEVIEFLQREFDRGLSHSSLNISRSAISLITEADIGNDPAMRRYFKGISKARPSKPKYNYTWNPKCILDYFSSKPSNENLTFKELSYKLITLLALVTGHRIQTLSLIKIENIIVSDAKVMVLIPDRIKTSKRGAYQPLLELPFFRDNVKICPASSLIQYLNITEPKRGEISELFISLGKGKCKAVCKQTLSNWIKNVLAAGGVDTNIFTAHSTRHASNSAAKRLGLNIEIVLKTANWSTESTFARFYDRPLINNEAEFAMTILSQS